MVSKRSVYLAPQLYIQWSLLHLQVGNEDLVIVDTDQTYRYDSLGQTLAVFQ